MTKNRIISITILTLVMFVFISCSGGKKVESENEEVLPDDIVELRADQIKLANIETGLIEKRTMNSTLKVSGKVAVSPQNHATVCMAMGGFIKSTLIMPGNSVRKGQKLAIIESQEFVDIQQNYLETKNRLDFTEAEYKRHNELFKDDVYSRQNLQQVTADYKNLKAQEKAWEQKLALIGIDPANFTEDDISSSVVLVSPISGYVKEVNVNIGKFVAPSDVLFEIINCEKLFIELSLFEKDADKVNIGQNISFFINNESEQHEAVVSRTGISIDADKVFKVYASVTNVCENMLPGMYVNAAIETLAKEVTALPSEAIVGFDDKDFIFIFERNKEEGGRPFTEYRIVEVQKGVSNGGYTEVILPSDINWETAVVVIKGAYNLLSAKKNAGEMAC